MEDRSAHYDVRRAHRQLMLAGAAHFIGLMCGVLFSPMPRADLLLTHVALIPYATVLAGIGIYTAAFIALKNVPIPFTVRVLCSAAGYGAISACFGWSFYFVAPSAVLHG